MRTLITGASYGLGEALTKIYARKGHDLVLVARSEDKLKVMQSHLIEIHGVKIDIFACDLSVESGPTSVYEFTQSHQIHIDLLINNAGFGDFGYFYNSELKKQEEMIQLNITSLMALTHYYLKDMKKVGHGQIMNMASMAGFMPGPMMSVYYATKAYVLSFTQAIAQELKGSNIHVIAYCPGPTKTGFAAGASLEKSGLFNSFQNVSPDAVALDAVKKLESGKIVSVHGFGNKVTVFLSRFAPRSLVRKIVMKIQK